MLKCSYFQNIGPFFPVCMGVSGIIIVACTVLAVLSVRLFILAWTNYLYHRRHARSLFVSSFVFLMSAFFIAYELFFIPFFTAAGISFSLIGGPCWEYIIQNTNIYTNLTQFKN